MSETIEWSVGVNDFADIFPFTTKFVPSKLREAVDVTELLLSRYNTVFGVLPLKVNPVVAGILIIPAPFGIIEILISVSAPSAAIATATKSAPTDCAAESPGTNIFI